MMATAALLDKNPSPTDDDIDANIANICRCGTYYRMRKAIHRAAELTRARRPAAEVGSDPPQAERGAAEPATEGASDE